MPRDANRRWTWTQRGPGTARGRVIAGGLVLAAVLGATGSAAAAAGSRAPNPSVQPRHGQPFVPAQGDWEGIVDGFPASFELRFDAALSARGGVAPYAVTDLVLLSPTACPTDRSRYGATFLGGSQPVRMQRFGGLAFPGDLTGRLQGARTAVLSTGYRAAGCAGTLAWRMHPARRVDVQDGGWTARFANGETARFSVVSGGRLATPIRLPTPSAGCRGVSGEATLFIGPTGRASLSESGETITLRFTGRAASGALTAPGCPGRPMRITASDR